MKNTIRRISHSPAAILFILLLSVNCRGSKLDSEWKNRDISIDGMQLDWENALTNLPDDKVNIGVMNDDDYLYICLVPLDETIIRQVMGRGFTVWVEADGDKKSKLGIHYPIGFHGEGRGNFRDRQMGEIVDREEFRKMAENSLKDFQIITADKKDTTTLSVDKTTGLEVRIGTRNERMVYEMRIPLQKTDESSYAINAEPGAKVKLQFETGEFKRPSGGHRPGGFGGPPEGGIGGGGMPPDGGGGMGGERPGGMRGGFERPQPLKFKLDIKLAKKESSGN